MHFPVPEKQVARIGDFLLPVTDEQKSILIPRQKTLKSQDTRYYHSMFPSQNTGTRSYMEKLRARAQGKGKKENSPKMDTFMCFKF